MLYLSTCQPNFDIILENAPNILAPPEGLRGPGLPGVNLGGQPRESGSDSKAI